MRLVDTLAAAVLPGRQPPGNGGAIGRSDLLSSPLSQRFFGSRVRAIATLAGDTPLRKLVFGPDRPPDPEAPRGAQIAAHKFPGELHRRLAEMAPYQDQPQAATG